MNDACNQFLEDFPKAVDEFHTLLTGNKIFQKRTQGVGRISAEDAIDWGLSGPCLRGSGVNLDIRRANPYIGYEKYDFEVPTEPDGDVWARYMVRMREMKRVAQDRSAGVVAFEARASES